MSRLRETAHLPAEDWTCLDDGAEWPCRPAKGRMWLRASGDERIVAEEMADWYERARRELVLSALQLHARFVGWIPRWPDP